MDLVRECCGGLTKRQRELRKKEEKEVVVVGLYRQFRECQDF